MSLIAACLQCGSRFAAPSHLAGTTVACPNCRAPIQVPLEAPPSAPARKKKRMRWALPVTPPPPPAGQPVYEVPAGDPAEPPTAPPVATAETQEQGGEHPLLLFPARGNQDDHVDITAMVDIVFFLLIFFLVTSLQAIEAVINLPSPRSDQTASARPADVIDYRNDPNYLVVVIDEGNNIWLDDEPVSGEASLRAILRSSADSSDRRKGMVIIGSGDATHGKLVMVLDAAADAGITDLLFTVTEDTDSL